MNEKAGKLGLFVVIFLCANASALTFVPGTDVSIIGSGGFADGADTVRTNGDLNGDGFNDLVVGAYSSKKVFVYFGGVDFDNLSDVEIADHTDTSSFGSAVAIGDFNGDGFDDLAVLASGTTKKLFLYYGGYGFDGISDVTVNLAGTAAYGLAACDFNGDGFSDVAVGAAYYDNKTYVYYGNTTFDTTLDLTIQDHNEQYFGWAMTCCDLNNNGVSDLAVGSMTDKKAYVYYGGTSFDGTSDVSITDHTTVTYFGSSVACGGDLNNDSVSDLAIGSSTYDSSGRKVYVYYGGSSFDGTSDLTISDHTDNYFGEALSNGGDINADGVNDLVVAVGANSVDAYVYYGGSSFDGTSDVTINEVNNNDAVDITGDLNGDGISDVVLGVTCCEVNVHFGAVSESDKQLYQVHSKDYNAFPTIITLQAN